MNENIINQYTRDEPLCYFIAFLPKSKLASNHFPMLSNVLLEKTLESSLDCKEIKPVNPKGNQS